MAGAIRLEASGLDELRARLDALGADATRAILRALNRTLTSSAVLARRYLAADTGLAQRAVDRSLTQKRATGDRLEALLSIGPYLDARGRMAKGGRIPLIEFRAREVRQGTTYTLQGGRGLAASAFIATMRSGHTGVFRRRRTQGPVPIHHQRGRRQASAGFPMAGRLPISELYGPSLVHIMRAKGLALILPQIDDVLAKNLEHEISFLESSRVA